MTDAVITQNHDHIDRRHEPDLHGDPRKPGSRLGDAKCEPFLPYTKADREVGGS